MFGLFKSRKSPVRTRIEELFSVRRTWFEWSFEGGRWESTLLVEVDWDTDPKSSGFYVDGLHAIASAINQVVAELGEVQRVRVIPRVYEG